MNMMSSIQSMMDRYQPQNAEAYRNALKEIVQEIALYGMSKSNLFQEGAFYRETALRIFYGLHRFSEDMDFSLVHPNPSFALSDYLPAVEEELSAVGLKMRVEQKNKTKVTDIQSAFIKGGTLIQIISIQQTDEVLIPGIHKQEQLKIKLEVDTNPPPGAGFELRYALHPVPYAVRLYDKPSLFPEKFMRYSVGIGRGELRDEIFMITSGIYRRIHQSTCSICRSVWSSRIGGIRPNNWRCRTRKICSKSVFLNWILKQQRRMSFLFCRMRLN